MNIALYDAYASQQAYHAQMRKNARSAQWEASGQGQMSGLMQQSSEPLLGSLRMAQARSLDRMTWDPYVKLMTLLEELQIETDEWLRDTI